MTSDRHTPPEDELGLPESLRAELRDAFRPPEPVPPALAERVLAAAPRLAPPRPAWHQRPRWIAAAAAVLVALVWLWPEGGRGVSSVAHLQSPPTFVAGAETDVLDAFRLARLLRDRSPRLAEFGWDVDRDGRVDEADVDRLLELAVRLQG